MMKRLYYTLSVWTLVMMMSILGLYRLASEIKDLEAHILDLEVAIASENEAIGVLEAEWSHLDDPKRIGYLSQRLLGLQPVEQLSPFSKTSIESLGRNVRAKIAREQSESYP